MDTIHLACILIAINFIGFLYGTYYYGDQLAETNPILWILVIDCPLQALLLSIVVFLAVLGKGSNILTAFTAAGSIKYGIWTMFVIIFHGDYFLVGTLALSYAIIFISHLGLFAEGLLISGIKKISGGASILILLLYLFNDYSDYIWGTHPLIPNNGIGTVAAVTIALSFLSVGFIYLAGRIEFDIFRSMTALEKIRLLVKKSIS